MESSYTATSFDRSIRHSAASLSGTGGRSKAFRTVLVLSLAHIPIGVIIYNQPAVGLVHQVCLFVFALYCALRDQKLERTAMIVGYIIGAEVLWRMAGVSIYWELGKFVSSFIFVVALIRQSYTRIPLLPVLYLAVLIPACLITLFSGMPSEARATLSSNMSGPLFLCVSCVFFANVTLTKGGIGRVMIAVLLPLFSVAFVTLFHTISLSEIEFTGESNFATSGGFGPNQVSSMLGLGAFLALFLLVIFRHTVRFKLFLVLTALLMSAQSVMTFSRGGMYNALGGVTAAVLLLLVREPSVTLRRLAPIVLGGFVFISLIFPAMDKFTGGSLGERFEDTQATNRAEILSADLNIFLAQPVFGAGVGKAYEMRQEFLDRKAMSHTEFARLISEHGFFGILAVAILVIIAVTNVRSQPTTFGKALVVGSLAWSTLFMTNAGMRLAAPAFLWGMTFVSIAGVSTIRSGRPRKRKAYAGGGGA